MKRSFKEILSGEARMSQAKAELKLPAWAGAGLEYPSALSLEQCSSSAAAAHKAGIAERIAGCGRNLRIADLTGGLGSDSYAFSKVASAVWYNERDAELAAAVERNFATLGVRNVEFHTFEVDMADGAEMPEWLSGLRSFAPDVIYLDPARRSASGKKVFLLEDCSPDIVALYPLLLDVAPVVIVKLSPMADITMVCRRLGGHVSEVHVVGLDRECKELVCVLHRDTAAGYNVFVDELFSASSPMSIWFPSDAENTSVLRLPESISGILLDPSPALLKSGTRKLLCERYGLVKLGLDTHLYLDQDSSGQAAESVVFKSLFRRYKILSVLPFSKESFKEAAMRYPCADVSAKNIHMTSEDLRTRLGVRSASSGGVHIYGVGVDYCHAGRSHSEKLLLVCEPF